MKLKTSVSLMIALVLGLVTAKVGSDLLKKYGGANAAGVKVVTAKRDMQPGHVIDAADVTLAEVSPKLVPSKAVKDLKDVIGRTVMTQVANGQTIIDGLLAPKGSGSGFQAMVPRGMRAVTLDVSDSAGVAGMLVPGSRVDVITTLRRGKETIAKAIVENVRVQLVTRGRSGYTSKGGQTTPIENGPVKTVTLLVTPRQASAIELANSSGSKPRLVLRGIGDNAAGDDGLISSNELVGIEDEPMVEYIAPPPVDDSTFDNVEPEVPGNRRAIQIIRGSAESTIYYEDEKKEEGSGASPSANQPAGAESRTASGNSPDSSPRTDVRSVLR